MKKLTAALALACALTWSAAAAAVDFGANDDTGKYAEDGGAVFFAQMRDANLKQNVMTVRWSPSAPTTIPDKSFLDRAVPAAVAAGITPVFAVYPYPPSQLEGGGVSPEAFATWLRSLADAFPQVTTFIVGNEPNLNTFWRPQGNGAGQILSGASFGPFLAAGYNALKAKSTAITVLGVGSSPRGERGPAAAGKSSPVHFLDSLGDWYRSSNLQTPLMDGFSFHPYPNPSDFTVPFTFAYGWPNASVQELPRIKQALYDAFNGTRQKTTLQGLKLYLDEVGWQVSTEGNGAYTGSENVRVTTEETQAQIYDQLVRFVVCDPDVAQLNVFGYWDEKDRGGWQAAPRRADGSARASNAALAAAIAATGGRCQGALRSWSPLTAPEGASVEFGVLNGKASKGKKVVARFVPTASEDVTVKAGFVPASTPASRIPALLQDAGTVEANRKPPKTATATAGAAQVLAVVLSAAMNPARTAVFKSEVLKAATTATTGKPKPTAKPKPTKPTKPTTKPKPAPKPKPKGK